VLNSAMASVHHIFNEARGRPLWLLVGDMQQLYERAVFSHSAASTHVAGGHQLNILPNAACHDCTFLRFDAERLVTKVGLSVISSSHRYHTMYGLGQH
jgi:hypothetical protein